jgi:3-oxoadipate enol-lactonase
MSSPQAHSGGGWAAREHPLGPESGPIETLSMTTDFAELNGTRLYFETAGSGPPLVFLHGFGLNRRMWDAQFEHFAQHFRVIRYDARGFGRSALPGTEPYSHADDLRALLGHLDIARTHLVGLSMGAMIAMEFDLTFPEMVDRLVLVDSAMKGHGWSAEWKASMKPVFKLGRDGDIESARARWRDHPLFASARANDQSRDLLGQIVADYSGWHWAHQNPERKPQSPLAVRLRDISAPALIVVGEQDLPDFQRIADLLLANIPEARKVVLPGAGHLSPLEAPEAFNALVLKYLT